MVVFVLLPVLGLLMFSDDFLTKIFAEIEGNNEATFTVDLEAQTFTIDSTKESEGFAIGEYKKKCMINGYDDIDYILSIKDKIEIYEANAKNRALEII